MQAPTLAGLLADDVRLRVVSAIALGARTIEAVADAAGVSEAEVRAVLPRLLGAEVLQQDDGLRVNVDALRDAARDRPARDRDLPDATPDEARVLRNFVEGGRLKSVPVRASQRRLVLEYLARRFEPNVDYPEAAVNDALRAYHEDYASLRRYLVDGGLLERSRGVYRRR